MSGDSADRGTVPVFSIGATNADPSDVIHVGVGMPWTGGPIAETRTHAARPVSLVIHENPDERWQNAALCLSQEKARRLAEALLAAVATADQEAPT